MIWRQAVFYGVHTKDTRSEICKAFLEVIEAANYYGLLYTYTSFANAYLDMSKLSKYDCGSQTTTTQCGYKGSYGMWQYTVLARSARWEEIITPTGSRTA
jgi:hypothetical protein